MSIELFQRVTELADAAERAPKDLANSEQAEKMADFMRQLTATIKKLEEAEKAEKKVHNDALAAIKEKYGKPLATLFGIKAIMTQAQTRYLEKANTDTVRSDYNSLTVLRETEGLEIDNDVIDLNLLKPFISWNEVYTATRKALKAGKDIPGAKTITIRKAVTR